MVPVVAAVWVVVAVVILHWEVSDVVRSRGLRLRPLGDILIVECEAPEGEDGEVDALKPVTLLGGETDDGLFAPGRIDDGDERVLAAPTIGTGTGGADANLSRRCVCLSLSLCESEGDSKGPPLNVCRSLGGNRGGIKSLEERGSEEGDGTANIGFTEESMAIWDCDGIDFRIRFRSGVEVDLARIADQIAVLVLLFVVMLVLLGQRCMPGGPAPEPEKLGTGEYDGPQVRFFKGETRMEDCNCRLETLAFAALLKPVAFEEMDGLREAGSRPGASTS